MKKISGGKRAVRKIAELRMKFGNTCMWDGCNQKDRLEFAHKVNTPLEGRSRGSWYRYKDIKNNPTRYFLLCWFHHQIYDERQIKKEIDV